MVSFHDDSDDNTNNSCVYIRTYLILFLKFKVNVWEGWDYKTDCICDLFRAGGGGGEGDDR